MGTGWPEELQLWRVPMQIPGCGRSSGRLWRRTVSLPSVQTEGCWEMLANCQTAPPPAAAA